MLIIVFLPSSVVPGLCNFPCVTHWHELHFQSQLLQKCCQMKPLQLRGTHQSPNPLSTCYTALYSALTARQSIVGAANCVLGHVWAGSGVDAGLSHTLAPDHGMIMIPLTQRFVCVPTNYKPAIQAGLEFTVACKTSSCAAVVPTVPFHRQTMEAGAPTFKHLYGCVTPLPVHSAPVHSAPLWSASTEDSVCMAEAQIKGKGT